MPGLHGRGHAQRLRAAISLRRHRMGSVGRCRSCRLHHHAGHAGRRVPEPGSRHRLGKLVAGACACGVLSSLGGAVCGHRRGAVGLAAPRTHPRRCNRRPGALRSGALGPTRATRRRAGLHGCLGDHEFHHDRHAGEYEQRRRARVFGNDSRHSGALAGHVRARAVQRPRTALAGVAPHDVGRLRPDGWVHRHCRQRAPCSAALRLGAGLAGRRLELAVRGQHHTAYQHLPASRTVQGAGLERIRHLRCPRGLIAVLGHGVVRHGLGTPEPAHAAPARPHGGDGATHLPWRNLNCRASCHHANGREVVQAGPSRRARTAAVASPGFASTKRATSPSRAAATRCATSTPAPTASK